MCASRCKVNIGMLTLFAHRIQQMVQKTMETTTWSAISLVLLMFAMIFSLCSHTLKPYGASWLGFITFINHNNVFNVINSMLVINNCGQIFSYFGVKEMFRITKGWCERDKMVANPGQFVSASYVNQSLSVSLWRVCRPCVRKTVMRCGHDDLDKARVHQTHSSFSPFTSRGCNIVIWGMDDHF
jgi:hypothetical protein